MPELFFQSSNEPIIHDTEKPSFWKLHVLGWMFYVLILTIDNIAFIGSDKLDNDLVIFPVLTSGIIALFLTWPLRYLYRHFWRLKPAHLILAVVFSSLMVAVIWTPLKNMVVWSWEDQFSILQAFQGHFDAEHQPSRLFMTISYAFFMVMVWSSLYFGINYHFRLVQEKEQHFRAVMLSHKSQIKMLRYQINPHFLFNTLNAISTLVLQGCQQGANDMLIKLSTFFRYSLDNDPDKKITLREEVDALKLYLDIEKTRFDERLTVEFDIEPNALNLLLPSLILQPLVENSIKYAISKMRTGGKILIQAHCIHGRLLMRVEDNGPFTNLNDLVFKEQGVGLKNIHERLNVTYPQQHSFDISVAEPHGFAVTLQIPVEHPVCQHPDALA
ncbi:sensor histidine kinase [Neptunicella marina]|uniref:Histidine kinase n=1 Tax=Neptunicella marina TaxID=2125989 RepID=A0A8J6IW09_9ALTE|nr:histidine kinase [Neptunicella marina]MBC3766453.1 histidine kinase [Neptunicella marina]